MKDTSETSPVESEPVACKNALPMGRWIVATLVLCIFATGWAILSPIYEAKQLIDFARNNGGRCFCLHNHPEWMSGFVPNDLFIPKYDNVQGYGGDGAPIPDRLLRNVGRLKPLGTMSLDISNCSADSISLLGDLDELSSLWLKGNHERIPLEWLQDMPALGDLRLVDIPLTDEELLMLLSLSAIYGFQYEYKDSDSEIFISLFRHGYVGGGRGLLISKNHLTQGDAHFLATANQARSFDFLTATYRQADPEFWSTIGQLLDLKGIMLMTTGPEEFELSQTELDVLKNFANLRMIILYDDINLDDDENVSPSWKEFREQRPDVEIMQYVR